MSTRAKQFTRPYTLVHPADSGGCGSYRMLWPAAALTEQRKFRGATSERLIPEQELKALKPEICILQRQYYDFQIQSMRMYRKHIPFMVYELDDILDKVPNWSIHKHQMPANVGQQLKTAFSLVDRVTTTTDFLANELRRVSKSKNVDVRVVPNFLPKVWSTLKPYKKHERVRVGWAGALAHKHDLSLLLPVMEHFGDRVDWVFMGLTPDKPPANASIQVVPGVPLNDYPMVLNSLDLDVGVIPLEVNVLNRSKSGIRVMELGINGCAVVATDLEPYQGFKNIVRVRNTPDQWIQALEAYVQNREMAAAHGAALRQEILAHHMLEDHIDQFRDAWGGDIYEPIAPRSSDITTIVIPVQKDPEATRKCFESVVASQPQNKTKTDIVVVQDSADASVKEVVKDFSSHFKEVVDHMTVKGFSGSVNDGMLRSTGDVVLLNSDCVVNGDWLDRMHTALKSAPNIGSVTPIGTDESFVSVNIEGTTPQQLDVLASRIYQNQGVEIGTPVGFCMLIRRETLRDVGLFDNKAFPRIYGEENDWGCSALLGGWKHMLAASTVVGHLGNRSVVDAANQQLRQSGLNTVILRYGFYQKLMQNIEPIQLRQFKSGLELEALQTGKPSIVLIGHNAGGGLETYIQRVGYELLKTEWDSFVVRPFQQNQAFLTFTRGGRDFKYPEPMSMLESTGYDAFVKMLKRVNAKLVVVNTLVSYPQWFDKYLMRACADAGIPYDVVIHDMYHWCPQLNMVTKNTQTHMQDKFCNSQSKATCEACVKRGTMFGFVDITEWRDKYGKFLDGARHIHVTSSTFVNLALNYITQSADWGPDKFKVHTHSEPELLFQQTPGPNVAVIGHNILPMKGSLYVAKLAQLMPHTKFYVFGNIQPAIALPNVFMAGTYQNVGELKARTAAMGCSVALFLSTWPEIHMYALTDAIQCGLSPIVFDLGAQAERVRKFQAIAGTKFGEVLPLTLMYNDQNIGHIAGAVNMVMHRVNTPQTLAEKHIVPAVNYDYIKDYFGLDHALQKERMESTQS